MQARVPAIQLPFSNATGPNGVRQELTRQQRKPLERRMMKRKGAREKSGAPAM